MKDIKEETIQVFFEHKQIDNLEDADKVLDVIYRYLKRNDRFFKLVLKSDEASDFALVLGTRSGEYLVDLLRRDKQIKDRNLLELELLIFTDGLALQCIRYYRGESEYTLEDIVECSRMALHNIISRRTREPALPPDAVE